MDPDRWERKRQHFQRRLERRRARLNSPSRHLIFGMVLVTIGMAFLLDNLGLVDVGQVFRFWPVILIAVGALKLIESRDDYSQSGAIFWIVIGSLLLLANIGIIRVALDQFWPIILIGLGVLMLWRSTMVRREFGHRVDTETTSSNSNLSATALFSGVKRLNNSQDFRGGDVTTIFGGAEIDLRGASIVPPHEPVLEVTAIFGGIEIRVPPDWTVVGRVDPVFGGYDDKTLQPKDETKRLIIHGSVVFGGIDVTN